VGFGFVSNRIGGVAATATSEAGLLECAAVRFIAGLGATQQAGFGKPNQLLAAMKSASLTAGFVVW